MLNRGQYSVGDLIQASFSDGDNTVCKVLGENSTRAGIRCEVQEVISGNSSVGERRTFLYGNNPSRTIILYDMPQGCNKVGVVQKLSNALERLLSPSVKSLYKAGFIGADLELTDVGRRELRDITRIEHEDKLVARAEAVLAERDEK